MLQKIMAYLCWLSLISSSCALAQKTPLNDFNVDRIKLRGVHSHDEQGISTALLEDRVNGWRVEEFPQRRLTLEQIQDLAFRLSRYYQDLGFSFVAATVPRQKISRGVVIIQVREDKLSDVQIRNVSSDQRKIMVNEFEKMIGKPVYKPNLEEPILLLNDNPNREVFAYFSRGKNRGDTRLNLNVKQTQSNGILMGLNNHGSPSTGTDKWWIAGDIKNPLGWDDSLHVDVSQSLENENNLAGSLSYETYSGSRDTYTYSITRNQYQLGSGLDFLRLTGEYTTLMAQLRQKLTRTFSKSSSQVFGFEYRRSELKSLESAFNFSQSEAAIILSYQDADTQYALSHGDYLTKNLQYSVIALTQDNDELSDPVFFKFSAYFQSGRSIAVNFPSLNTSFITKLSLQYSPQVLPSADKKTLSGNTGVRAFEPGTFSADEAAVLQLHMKGVYASKLGVLEPYAFYDHAYGIRKALGNEVGAELSGFGVGLKFNYGTKVNFDVTYASSLTGKIGSLERPTQGLILFSVNSQLY